MSHTYDVIVIGVGGMGSAACWQLARRGARVLGLERFDIPHAQGSSHGLTRIVRLPQWHGGPYGRLIRRAYELWREAEMAYGETLLHITGSLQGGPDGGDDFGETIACCQENGFDHDILTAAEVNQRFPGFHLPEGHKALFQPDGGFVASERAIVAHVTLAQAAGAEIRAQERVRDWQPIAGGGVRVVTDRGTYEAGRLVLSAGAWISDFVPALKTLAVPERQVLGWFQPDAPQDFSPARFPVSILFVEEGPYYMLPIWGAPGLKIGLHHHLRETSSAEDLSRTITAEDEAALRRCLERYLPRANGPVMALRSCIYTNTPDEDFILDLLPGHEEVVVASPCSGHGYKFASAIGELIADLATTGSPTFDISAFRLARFACIAEPAPAIARTSEMIDGDAPACALNTASMRGAAMPPLATDRHMTIVAIGRS